jgi:hypothetical protein
MTTVQDTTCTPTERGFFFHTTPRGFRYYEPATYILAFYNPEDNKLMTKILSLPDTTKRMSSRPYAYFATNNTTLNFTDKGILLMAVSNVDSSAVPSAILTTAANIGAAVVKAGPALGDTLKITPNAGADTFTGPYMFRLVMMSNGCYGLIGDGGQCFEVPVKAADYPTSSTVAPTVGEFPKGESQ